MTDLLDINVWLALTDENHTHHSRAAEYWQNEAQQRIAFCRTTMLGYLRLSTHPQVLSRPLTVQEAWAAYHSYREQPGVCFLSDLDAADVDFKIFTLQESWSHRFWTDAYLAGLAKRSDARLVSFDNDFKCFKSLKFLQLYTD